MNGNVNWYDQYNINNKQISVVQKNDKCNDVLNKYQQKNDDQGSKLLFLREKAIENYKYL